MIKQKNTLLVIISDSLSELIKKGEVTERYYNPGDFFDNVHILLINSDKPDLVHVQKMVGNAKLHLHNLPVGRKIFMKSLALRPFLLHYWARPAIELARLIRPSLIRCHGVELNAFVAYSIHKFLKLPYVISLHTNPDENRRYWSNTSIRERIRSFALRSVEEISLKHAQMVMPVYESLIPYIERMGINRFEVCYNALNPSKITKKLSYDLSNPSRLLWVGRLIPGKNPENIIRSLTYLPQTVLTIVGDGLLRESMMELAKEIGVNSRVEFIASLDNDTLCSNMKNYDIFVVHCEFGGVPKTVLEAFLVGMPVVINMRNGDPVPELTKNICRLTDNSPEGYRRALSELIRSSLSRQSLGESAYAHAAEYWSPEKTERKFVKIYKKILMKS